MQRAAWLVVLGLSTVVPRAEASDVIYAATSNGVFKSVDEGGHWTPVNNGLGGVAVFALAVDPKNPAIVYAGTFRNRVFKTVDGGALWAPAYIGFSDDTALALAIDPINPATVYAGTTTTLSAAGTSAFFPGSGVLKTSNAGSAWIVARAGLPPTVVTVVATDPSNPAVVYAGTSVAGVYKTTDRGETWRPANNGISSSDISDLVVDPMHPEVLYAAIEGCSAGCSAPAGVFKSLDGGASWTSASRGIVDDLQVLALAVNPADTRVLYAATRFDGIYKSTDAGGSWTQVNNAATGTLFSIVHFSLVIDPDTPGTVYAGTFDGILKSSDGGLHWAAAGGGLPPSTKVFALALHPRSR